MKLLHQYVAALFFIYHAYATSTNTEPCEKKDDGGTFLFICLVAGFFIIKHSENQRRDREEAYSDEDEEQEDSGDEADTEEDSDAEEPDTEEEGEEDDSDAEESEVEDEEPVEAPKQRKSRRLGSKATLADSHS